MPIAVAVVGMTGADASEETSLFQVGVTGMERQCQQTMLVTAPLAALPAELEGR